MVNQSTPEELRNRTRRRALMAERTIAIDNRDWARMNEITKRIAKIDPPGWTPERCKGKA